MIVHVGFEGWMLGVLSAGAAPEKNVFRAIVQVRRGGREGED